MKAVEAAEARRIMGALETLVSTEDGPWKFGWPDDVKTREFRSETDDTSEMFTMCLVCDEPYVCHDGYRCPGRSHYTMLCRGGEWMKKHGHRPKGGRAK